MTGGVTPPVESELRKRLSELDQTGLACMAAAFNIRIDDQDLQEELNELQQAEAMLERSHHRLHRLRGLMQIQSSLISRRLYDLDPERRRRTKPEPFLAPVFEQHPFDLSKLWKAATTRKALRAEAEVLLLELGETIIRIDESVRKRVHGDPWWPTYFAMLARLDKPVLYYSGAPAKAEYLFEEILAADALSAVETERDRRASKKTFRDELSALEPPLTWPEVVYWVLKSPEMAEGIRAREMTEFLKGFARVYCVKCDSLFAPSIYRPAQLVCPKCHARERKRHERQEKRSARDSTP